MRASSNSSPGDKARRPVRTAPRRHTDPNERPVSATYDSNEFPVLLRMPDLHEGPSESAEAVSQVEQNAPRVELPPTPTQPLAPPTGGRRSRSKSKEQISEKQSTTAIASRLFWGTLAPKLAVGGMLLSVTALCVVVLQSPSQDKPADSTETKWAVDDESTRAASENSSTVSTTRESAPFAPATTEPSTAQRHSVATRPEPIQATAPKFDMTSPDVSPVGPTPALMNDQPSTWPGSSIPSPSPTVTPSESSQPFQAQGWPDDVEADTSTTTAAETQLQLNAARRQLPTRVSSSSRGFVPPSVPTAQEPAGGSAGARLNGTVEIPNPRAKFRL
jgi:hypothetical protein